ncbi:MAG: hypothetical protein GC202_09275 [Alphaproteobacteria bacterium]|nr:hypothetical protein [Alphaproteobacteria bacterium]
MFRLTIAVLLALAVAACGPLPRPFQPDEKTPEDNPLLLLPDFGGVVVPPALGLPGEPGRAFAEAVADALRKADVPANVNVGNPSSLILDLQVETAGGRARVSASLVDPKGVSLADRRAEAVVQGDTNDPATWRPLATPIANAIVGAIKPEAVISRALPSVRIVGVKGAPGDGARALERSLAYHLEKAGLRIADVAGPDVLAVAGTVEISDAGADTRKMRVTWQVSDAKGAELGRVDMQNPVPVRVLERQWAELAYEVAGASADGIRDIAERFRVRPK